MLISVRTVLLLLILFSSGCVTNGRYTVAPADLQYAHTLEWSVRKKTAIAARDAETGKPVWVTARSLTEGQPAPTENGRIEVATRAPDFCTPTGVVLNVMAAGFLTGGAVMIATRGGDNAGLSLGGGLVLVGAGAAHAIVGLSLILVGRTRVWQEVRFEKRGWSFAPEPAVLEHREREQARRAKERTESLALQKVLTVRPFASVGIGFGRAVSLEEFPPVSFTPSSRCPTDPECERLDIAVAPGLRVPFALRFEFTSRLDVAAHIRPSSEPGAARIFGRDPSVGFQPLPAEYHYVPMLEIMLDATLRIRPISPASRWYLGFGGRIGTAFMTSAQSVSYENPSTGMTETIPIERGRTRLAAGGVIETGALLGLMRKWDLGVRLILGYPTIYRLYATAGLSFR